VCFSSSCFGLIIVQIIRRFKTGEFNVLVSTSIGEEGLDIGEIDMIVCYDAQKTPIRMVSSSC
jgi:ATP-dependent DNA helicase MPH1